MGFFYNAAFVALVALDAGLVYFLRYRKNDDTSGKAVAKTGAFQRDLVQAEGVQFLLLWGGAFAVTGHRSEGLVAALLYFVLKHHVSAGETGAVCFEGV